ncbi:MAG: HAMP domain-containing protein, partial [Thermodesulfovibrionia bacterium]|nr:HAMP domain-containing protein [Thermodesulfovibrionia bacterium]
MVKTEGVERVRIFDHEGKIFYSSEINEIAGYVDKGSIACKACHAEPEKSAELLPNPQKWVAFKNPKGVRALKVVGAIYNEKPCYTADCHIHQKNQKILGLVEAEASLALLGEAKLKQGLALTAYVIIFFLAISVSLGVILWRLVSKPVSQLAHGMETVAAGDFDHSVPVNSIDEVGALAKTFNSMINDIKAARDQRESWTRTLEEEVAKKTEEIQKTHASLVQTEKLASLGRMAAGVAHEINNPLTGIVTFAHLMRKRVPQDSIDAEDLNVIIEQAERCAKIIKSLLTFARATPSEKGEININDVLSRTIYMVINQAKFHNIKFNINIEESDFITLGDASQFQQIFLNMFINAADAMNERGTITVATRKTTIEDKPFVEIEFTDTGTGIPEEILEKLYEPFFTTKPVGQGTGLGLSVSHGIIKHFGGQIDLKSTVGKGTSFFVKLPLLKG